jgi:hypothetical protein
MGIVWKCLPELGISCEVTAGEGRSMPCKNGGVRVRREMFWLPTLDTFRTFLSDSNPNYPALANLVCATKAPDLEALHG